MVARSVVTEGLAGLDERLRALQVSISREAASAQERQAEMARAVAVQATDHAVLAQWMKDWTAEVTAWRKCIEERMSAVRDPHPWTTSEVRPTGTFGSNR